MDATVPRVGFGPVAGNSMDPVMGDRPQYVSEPRTGVQTPCWGRVPVLGYSPILEYSPCFGVQPLCLDTDPVLGYSPILGYSPCSGVWPHSGVQPLFGAQFPPHIHPHYRPSGATSGARLWYPSDGNRGKLGWDFTGIATFLGTSAPSKATLREAELLPSHCHPAASQGTELQDSGICWDRSQAGTQEPGRDTDPSATS